MRRELCKKLEKIFMKNKVKLFIAFVIILVIFVPLVIDHCIIANNFPSNLENEQWFSFLSNYLGGIFGGLATLIAMWMAYTQTNLSLLEQRKENETNRRLAMLPFLQIDIEGINCKEDGSGKYLIENINNVIQAVVLTTQMESSSEHPYPYRISNSRDIIEFVEGYVEKGFVQKGEAGICVKEVTITNIGLQAAVVINCFLNNHCIWKFNLGKEQVYKFWLVITSEMLEKRIDIIVDFRDLYGNEYWQRSFYEAKIETVKSLIPSEEIKVERFLQSMTTEPLLKESNPNTV